MTRCSTLPDPLTMSLRPERPPLLEGSPICGLARLFRPRLSAPPPLGRFPKNPTECSKRTTVVVSGMAVVVDVHLAELRPPSVATVVYFTMFYAFTTSQSFAKFYLLLVAV